MSSTKKRRLDEDDAPEPKKQRKSEATDNDESSDDKALLKELNAYLLWFDQFYASKPTSKEVYTKMKKPLKNIINQIDFEHLSNIWFDSAHILPLIEERCALQNVTITKVLAEKPDIGKLAYKKSHLCLYKCFGELINSIYKSTLAFDLTSELKSELDESLLHMQACPIEFFIGNNENVSSFAGIFLF